MATEDYVPVAADDWYQRRREDEEGKFFRAVAHQGPRKGEGGATRQGIYCFTADGRLLAYKNAGQLPDVMRDTLRAGLREWQKLPEDRRKPGAVKVACSGRKPTRTTGDVKGPATSTGTSKTSDSPIRRICTLPTTIVARNGARHRIRLEGASGVGPVRRSHAR